MTDAPVVITGASMVTTGHPVVIAGASVVMIGASVVMIDAPDSIIDASLVVVGASDAGSGRPLVVSGRPVVTLRRPLVKPGHGVVMAGRPGVPSVVIWPCAAGQFLVECAWKEAPMHPSRTPIVLLAALVLAASVPLPVASAQPGPLTEPFPRTFDLASIDGRNGFRVEGYRESVFHGFMGSTVSGAGDVNGDGIADILIGMGAKHGEEGSIAGHSYVVFGREGGLGSGDGFISTTELDGLNGFAIDADRLASNALVAPAGDVNGDGFGDVLATS